MCDNMVFRRERDLTYNRLASMIQTLLSAESSKYTRDGRLVLRVCSRYEQSFASAPSKAFKVFSFNGKLYDELFLRGLCLSKRHWMR